MSAFVLKVIALISMAIDHTGHLIYGGFSFMNYIGRIAFPIFAFQISEGYTNTSNLKKYFLRLLSFALISQIPFMLFISMYSDDIFSLNIFFTLLLGLLSITIYDKLDKIDCSKYIHILYKFFGIIIILILSCIAELANCDYGYFGVLIIFAFFLFRNNKILMNFAFISLVLIYYAKNLLFSPMKNIYLGLAICTMAPLIFINLYNRQKRKKHKVLFVYFLPSTFTNTLCSSFNIYLIKNSLFL